MGLTLERSDSPFGRFTHAAWSDPCDPLLSSARIWYFEGTLAHGIERHYPDGTCGIIVQLETPHAPADAPDGRRFPALCTNGLATTPFGVVAPEGTCRVVGIVLEPGMASAALGVPLADLCDSTLDLHDVIGAVAARELGERCADERDAAAIVSAARRWLRGRLARASGVDPGVAHALERLRAACGNVSVAELERETGIAGPRLARRFAATVGTTPKRYARILRFNHALQLICNATRADLAAAATTAGYFDQSHMYADFAEFCDRTPAEFARALHYPGTVNIAENGDASLFSKTA